VRAGVAPRHQADELVDRLGVDSLQPRIGEVTRRELAELIEDAWLSRASPTRANAWLREHPAG